MNKKSTEIKVRYRQSEDYRDLPVAGTIVTTTPHGMILCCPYSENVVLPDESILIITTAGRGEEKIELSGEIERIIQAGLHCRVDVAENLGHALIKHAQQLKVAISKAEKGDAK